MNWYDLKHLAICQSEICQQRDAGQSAHKHTTIGGFSELFFIEFAQLQRRHMMEPCKRADPSYLTLPDQQLSYDLPRARTPHQQRAVLWEVQHYMRERQYWSAGNMPRNKTKSHILKNTYDINCGCQKCVYLLIVCRWRGRVRFDYVRSVNPRTNVSIGLFQLGTCGNYIWLEFLHARYSSLE